MSHQEPPSLHVSSLPEHHVVVFAYDTRIVLFHMNSSKPTADNNTPQLTTLSWSDVQRIRAIQVHIHPSSGKLLVVTGGDEKLLRVFSVTTVKDGTWSVATASHEVLTCGRYQKKISSLTCAGDDVVLSDKFGEVFRVTLVAAPEGRLTAAAVSDDVEDDVAGVDDEDEEPAPLGDEHAAPASAIQIHYSRSASSKFLLQHFGLITHCGFVPKSTNDSHASSSGFLITTDREAHIRVSRFPQAFVIEQFLWTPSSPQAPVTALLPRIPVACENVIFATGHRDGRVTVWGGRNSADTEGKRFHVVHQLHTCTEGGVIDVACLSVAGRDAQGLLVAVDGSKSIHFFPMRVGGYGVAFGDASQNRSLELSAAPLALVTASASSAFALLRDLTVVKVMLECDHAGESSRCLVAPPTDTEKALMASLRELLLASDDEAAARFAALDVFAHWRPVQAKDPRFKQSHQDEARGEDLDSSIAHKKQRNE